VTGTLAGSIGPVQVDASRSSVSDAAYRALSGGVKDPEATGFGRIASHDLDWRPSPLPNADSRRAAELDLPAAAFDGNARPGLGDTCPVCAVESQQLGEHGNRVVTLEGHEGGRFT